MTLILQDIGELDLIERIKDLVNEKQMIDPNILTGIGDDAAAIKISGETILLTTDTLVENVHFKYEYANPESIGYKAIISNISDIAAMAGTPMYALITLGAPAATNIETVEELYRGILGACRLYGLTIVGGDTVSSITTFIGVTVMGVSGPGPIRHRSDAKPGDIIMVTGDLGASAAGLSALENKIKMAVAQRAIKRYLRPEARVLAAQAAARAGANAIEDVSDGLLSEIQHICAASHVGAVINKHDLPLDESTSAIAKMLNIDPLDWALGGGEDYELVITAPAQLSEVVVQAIIDTNTPISVIGQVISGSEITVIGNNGRSDKVVNMGYEHFKRS